MVFCCQNCSDLLWEKKKCSSNQEKTFGIQGWRPTICKFFNISGTIYWKVRTFFGDRMLFLHVPGGFSIMCSKMKIILDHESRDLSRDEIEITACKAEQIHIWQLFSLKTTALVHL